MTIWCTKSFGTDRISYLERVRHGLTNEAPDELTALLLDFFRDD